MSERAFSDENAFLQCAAGVLDAIEAALEPVADDVEIERLNEGMLQLEFADGSQMVINRHAVAQEIWVAARSGGFHFRHQGGQWVDTRDGQALNARLTALLKQQGGVSVSF